MLQALSPAPRQVLMLQLQRAPTGLLRKWRGAPDASPVQPAEADRLLHRLRLVSPAGKPAFLCACERDQLGLDYRVHSSGVSRCVEW